MPSVLVQLDARPAGPVSALPRSPWASVWSARRDHRAPGAGPRTERERQLRSQPAATAAQSGPGAAAESANDTAQTADQERCRGRAVGRRRHDTRPRHPRAAAFRWAAGRPPGALRARPRWRRRAWRRCRSSSSSSATSSTWRLLSPPQALRSRRQQQRGGQWSPDHGRGRALVERRPRSSRACAPRSRRRSTSRPRSRAQLLERRPPGPPRARRRAPPRPRLPAPSTAPTATATP